MDRQDVLAMMDRPFGRSILRLIASAYDIRRKTHDESVGDNAMTFGMNVRFTVEKLLEDAFASTSDIAIARPMGSFQISYAEHIFHFYKFGMNFGDSIDDLSFEDSTTKMNLVIDNQLSLPGIPHLRHWIVAHSGNPQQGLIEVYIGAPRTLGAHGSPWAWRHQLYAAHEQLDFREMVPGFFS